MLLPRCVLGEARVCGDMHGRDAVLTKGIRDTTAIGTYDQSVQLFARGRRQLTSIGDCLQRQLVELTVVVVDKDEHHVRSPRSA